MHRIILSSVEWLWSQQTREKSDLYSSHHARAVQPSTRHGEADYLSRSIRWLFHESRTPPEQEIIRAQAGRIHNDSG